MVCEILTYMSAPDMQALSACSRRFNQIIHGVGKAELKCSLIRWACQNGHVFSGVGAFHHYGLDWKQRIFYVLYDSFKQEWLSKNGYDVVKFRIGTIRILRVSIHDAKLAMRVYPYDGLASLLAELGMTELSLFNTLQNVYIVGKNRMEREKNDIFAGVRPYLTIRRALHRDYVHSFIGDNDKVKTWFDHFPDHKLQFMYVTFYIPMKHDRARPPALERILMDIVIPRTIKRWSTGIALITFSPITLKTF